MGSNKKIAFRNQLTPKSGIPIKGTTVSFFKTFSLFLVYVYVKILRCGLDTDNFAFAFFFFQRLLHYSWNMNSAFRLMNSNPHCSCTRITLCKRHCVLFTHCSQDPQPLYSEKKKIKNGSYSTIHTFKNYFTTVFSVFNKINCIQTDPKMNID